VVVDVRDTTTVALIKINNRRRLLGKTLKNDRSAGKEFRAAYGNF